MREFFLKLFADQPANEFNGISMFSWTHIFYLILIFGAIALVTIFFRKKDLSVRIKILDIIAILIMVSYISDFFFQPFWHNGTLEANGEIVLDKFPFHICIVLCPLILFSRFSKIGDKIKTPFALLAIAAPLMWLVYPGTALDTDQSAFSYEVMQLFIYHGLVFIYGMLYLLLHEQKLDIKKCYKEAIAVVGIALWATLGNLMYSNEDHDYNWFFLKDPVFGFIPEAINPFVVVIVVYLSCLLFYGIYYLVIYLYNKRTTKKVTE